MKCRKLCGSCCIAPSINSPLPGMPNGKPAGVPCVNLDENFLCRIFNDPAVILTGCLGSTLGGALVILLWASAMLLLAIGYKRWSLLLFGAMSAVPGFLYAVLYLIN